MTFIGIDYGDLSAPQKEIYNFQKVAARLADFGYDCIRLSDDWRGADFHVSPHGDLMRTVRQKDIVDESSGIWRDQGFRHWSKALRWAYDFPNDHKLPQAAP